MHEGNFSRNNSATFSDEEVTLNCQSYSEISVGGVLSLAESIFIDMETVLGVYGPSSRERVKERCTVFKEIKLLQAWFL